jgi:hypothetical protein
VTSGSRLLLALGAVVVAVIAALEWKRPLERTPVVPSAAPPDVPTQRMRRETMRAKILTAILDEASAPPAKEKEAEEGEHRRVLTKALVGVPNVSFPAEYMARIEKGQLAPLARKCFGAARAKKPDAHGEITVRYVVVAAPNVGGVIEDATVDESTIGDDDLDECIHESALELTFDGAPNQGGWKEAGFTISFGSD